MSSFRQIRTVLTRSHATLIEDAVGAAALGVMLIGFLLLPGLI